jgi:hypothetical protein
MRALRWMGACAVLLGCVSGEDFCRSSAVCNEASCEPDADDCTTFDEATELAMMPYSGVHTLRLRRDPERDNAATARALNDRAICRGATCYTRTSGKIALEAEPAAGQQFSSWSCDERTAPRIELSSVHGDTECVAHFVPGQAPSGE